MKKSERRARKEREETKEERGIVFPQSIRPNCDTLCFPSCEPLFGVRDVQRNGFPCLLVIFFSGAITKRASRTGLSPEYEMAPIKRSICSHSSYVPRPSTCSSAGPPSLNVITHPHTNRSLTTFLPSV